MNDRSIPCQRTYHVPLILSTALWIAGGALAFGQDTPDPLRGYSTFTEIETRLKRLESSRAELRSLGETSGKRSIWLLTVADDPKQVRPAILVVGNVVAPHVLGRELALRMAEEILKNKDSDPFIEDLLSRFTLYFIPSPTPDATEKNFRFPVSESVGNEAHTDDDRDFTLGEDPPTDLNHDGWVTQMRVKEQFGTHRPHPKDPRVLIPIDSSKREVGEYRVWPEARDLDMDERFGEDAGSGVVFNRNFPFNYPYFGQGAGPHQVSEIETRAVADFMFDHPNIAAVLCFSPQDNLHHPWKASPATDAARIKTKVLTADQLVLDQFAKSFRKHHGGKSAPKPPAGEGSFSEFSYFHFGRWTFASRGWWIPSVASKQPDTSPKSQKDEKEKSEADDTAGSEKDSTQASDENAPLESKSEDELETTSDVASSETAEKTTLDPPCSDKINPDLGKDDKRGADEIAALTWFESQGISGFVPWKKIKHPDLKDKHVEIGGLKPLMLLNPPEGLIQPLVSPYVKLLNELACNWPKVEIREVEALDRGNGLFDIRCKIVNTSAMPTMPKMGDVNRQWYPIQVELEGSNGATMIEGSQRVSVGRLEENGGSKEVRWVLLLDKDAKPNFWIRAKAPTLHESEAIVDLIKP